MKSTAEKTRLKRKELHKQMHYGKVLATKNVMLTNDQILVRNKFAAASQARYEKQLKIFEKAERKRFEKKGLDYDAYIADNKAKAEADKKAHEAESKKKVKEDPWMLTKNQVKRGIVKRVCKCGNVVKGLGISELFFCGNCGALSKEAKKNYTTVKQGSGYAVVRKGYGE